MMAIGSLFVFMAAVGILPGGVLLGRRNGKANGEESPPKASSAKGWVGRYMLNDPRPAPGESRMTSGLEAIVESVERHPWRIALVTAGLLVFGALAYVNSDIPSADSYVDEEPAEDAEAAP